MILTKKLFLAKPETLTGTDIIDMILKKEECANFIAGKIYQFFVNDERDENIIKQLGNHYI